MVKIERFEDIEAWKKAREIAQQVYSVTCSGDFARDFGLRDQVQRAAVSIMANIAEGFDGGSNKEFIRFLGYALRSATELQSHLYVAVDQGYFNHQTFKKGLIQNITYASLLHYALILEHDWCPVKLGLTTEEEPDFAYMQCVDPGEPYTEGGTVIFKCRKITSNKVMER